MKYQGNICPNCFDAAYSNGECSKCGYKEIYSQNSSRALTGGIILNNRYIIGKVLGEGGFGITYKACDLKEGNICAIKEYAPTGIAGRPAGRLTMRLAAKQQNAESYEKGLKRFLDEARILRKLGDIPAVVKVLDCFQENNTAYFAMEFLDGANLSQIVRVSMHRIPFEEITGIIVQVGLAMESVHKKGHILHRDISPENIYITKEKQVKLIDFGSAEEDELQRGKEHSVVLRLQFAPPEQHSSKMSQGPYTDVYALAGTYYYALTGMNLPTAVDRLSGESYVTLKQINLGIPEYVSDAVDRALLLDCQDRTKTMKEFVEGITGKKPVTQVTAKASGFFPYLEVVTGRMSGVRFHFPSNMQLKIGRSLKENNIAVSGHQEVSKIHCYLYFDEMKLLFYITDISRNGTFINGKRLIQGQVYTIKPGNEFALASGDCLLRAGIERIKKEELSGYEYREGN